jgi:hypothetical protein
MFYLELHMLSLKILEVEEEGNTAGSFLVKFL